MGHGAGEKYIKKQDLQRMHNLNNVAVLMGCCSAKLVASGDILKNFYNFKGIVYDYLSSDVWVKKQDVVWIFVVSDWRRCWQNYHFLNRSFIVISQV